MGEDLPLTDDELAAIRALGYTPCGGGLFNGVVKVTTIWRGEKFSATRAEWRRIIAEESKPLTEDEIAFGRDAWVYCRQHMKAHQTGWCGVGPQDKVGLGVGDAEAATNKCRAWGFPLYSDWLKEHGDE